MKEVNFPSETMFKREFDQGLAAYDRGDYAEALEIFEKLAQMAPHASEVFLNIGNIHFKLACDEQAEAHWKKAVEIDPLEANAYLNLGNLYFKNDRLEEAIANWDIFKKIQKNHANVWLNLGVAYDKLGDPVKAAASYSGYFKLAAGSAESLKLKTRFDAARKLFENHVQVAEARLANGRAQEAVEVFRKALAAYPGSHKLYKTFASLLYQQQEYGEALNHYLKAYDKKNDDVTVLINLGVLYEKLNRPVDALWAFNQAMQFPSAEQGRLKQRFEALLSQNKAKFGDYFEEAKGHFRRGKLQQAETGLRRLNDLSPHLGPLAAEADEWLEKVEEARDPQRKAARTYLAKGIDAQNAGRWDQAIQFYQKFLTVQPKGKKADEVRKRLDEIKMMMGAALKSFLEQG